MSVPKIETKAGIVKQLAKASVGNDEWHTPEWIIALARDVMGGIDVDPASSEAAQKVVKAPVYYTLETDGLRQEWRGRVWLNPPYSRRNIDAFIAALARQFEAGHITQFLVLVNNATEVRWARQLFDIASAVCLITGRIRFTSPVASDKSGPTRGQMLAYGCQPEHCRLNEFMRATRAIGVAFERLQ